ncbi:Hypothetical_protein [Hexamita inflata]|uniref:Hypothetical_protein n=1 Tax=Hexamita inflata TaxID=28002 RepID=A0AA86NUA3_9EUKA|nr:Hypothetical protein HINF_LOCUS13945 [Hexamita inflata]
MSVLLTFQQKELERRIQNDFLQIRSKYVSQKLVTLQQQLKEIQQVDYMNKKLFKSILVNLLNEMKIRHDPQSNIACQILSAIKSDSDCYHVLLPQLTIARARFQHLSQAQPLTRPEVDLNYTNTFQTQKSLIKFNQIQHELPQPPQLIEEQQVILAHNKTTFSLNASQTQIEQNNGPINSNAFKRKEQKIVHEVQPTFDEFLENEFNVQQLNHQQVIKQQQKIDQKLMQKELQINEMIQQDLKQQREIPQNKVEYYAKPKTEFKNELLNDLCYLLQFRAEHTVRMNKAHLNLIKYKRQVREPVFYHHLKLQDYNRVLNTKNKLMLFKQFLSIKLQHHHTSSQIYQLKQMNKKLQFKAQIFTTQLQTRTVYFTELLNMKRTLIDKIETKKEQEKQALVNLMKLSAKVQQQAMHKIINLKLLVKHRQVFNYVVMNLKKNVLEKMMKYKMNTLNVNAKQIISELQIAKVKTLQRKRNLLKELIEMKSD